MTRFHIKKAHSNREDNLTDMQKDKHMSTKSIALLFITATFIAAIFFVGCSTSANARTDDTQVSGLQIAAVQARRGTVYHTVHYSGTIRGVREVALSPGLSSWIVDIPVKEGDRVVAGQIVAKLAPEQLDQAAAQFKAAEQGYERMKKLHEQGTITQQQFDEVEAGYKAAKAGYELAARSTELRAPFAGIVASINGERGQLFNAMTGINGVAKIVDMSEAKIELAVSERDRTQLVRGQRAIITLPAFPDTTIDGYIDAAAEIADAASGTYKVTVLIKNGGRMLKSGMFAAVNLVIAEARDAIVVPQTALASDTLIYVVVGDKAQARKITLGVESDSTAQVTSGLEAGELIVTEGILGMFDGAPVMVKK